MSPTATPHASPRVPPSLGWFVSLSLLLHLGLLWSLLAAQTPTPGSAAQEQTTHLAVRLLQRSAPAPAESRAPPAAAKAVAAKPLTQKKPRANVVQTAPRTEPLSTTEQTEPPRQTSDNTTLPAAATSDDDATLQQHLKVTLQLALADHFTYPLLARRRGWQGEVVLAFRLESDGRILDARIARSSGYGVLDHAALAALGKVKRIERGIPHSLTLQLPVIYRLEG